MLRIPTRWLIAVLVLALCACGNKGDLVQRPAPGQGAAPTTGR